MSTPTGDSGGSQPDRPYGSQGQYGGDQGQYPQGEYQQGQYPQGQYGAAYPAGGTGQPAQAPRNGLGVTALVLGIIGLVLTITFVLFWLGGLLGLLAIIFGILGMSRAKKGLATNRGVAIGGLVTGILALLGAIVITVFTVFLFSAGGGGELVSCLEQAGPDTAAQQACGERFGQQLGGY